MANKKKSQPTVADVLRNPDRYAAELKSLAMGGFVSPLGRFPDEHRRAVESWPDRALDALTPGDAAVILESQISAGQRAKARKPRPKRKPTCKSVIVAAMRSARASGQTFSEFLASSLEGSVPGIDIQPIDDQYEIDVDVVDGIVWVLIATLKKWWSLAGK